MERKDGVHALVKDACEGPALQLPDAPDQASRAMLPLVAVDEDGVVPPVEDGHERTCDHVLGDVVERLLVARDAELLMWDVVSYPVRSDQLGDIERGQTVGSP